MTPHQLGRHDFRHGKTLNDNPFVIGSNSFNWWQWGWEDERDGQ